MDRNFSLDSTNSPNDCSNSYVDVVLNKKNNGFGFNIVGGIDRPHIPGYNGFFVSRIGPNCDAVEDNRLEVGDIIVAVNGTSLENKTHQEAVDIFRLLKDSCVLKIEKHGERRILDLPTPILPSPKNSTTKLFKKKEISNDNISKLPLSDLPNDSIVSPSEVFVTAPSTPYDPPSTGSIKNSAEQNVSDSVGKSEKPLKLPLDDLEQFPKLTSSNKSPPLSNQSSNQSKKRRSNNSTSKSYSNGISNNINAQSTSSEKNSRVPYISISEQSDNLDSVSVISTTNISDDLQKTPKHSNHSPFDLSHNSALTEVLIVSLGTVALGAAIFVGYRYFKKH